MIQSCGQPGAQALVFGCESLRDVLQRLKMPSCVPVTESMVGDEGDAAAEKVL